MKFKSARWLVAVAVTALLAACGGSDDGGGGSTPLPPDASLKAKIDAAAADPANDTSSNSSASFTVLQNAGVPAVIVNGAPKVNFTVFSDGAVVKNLAIGNVSLVIAKLVPAANGEPDKWETYTHRTRNAATGTSSSPYVQATLDNPAYPSTTHSHADPKAGAANPNQLVLNADGYYTYTFTTDITDPTKTAGVIFERGRTHRVGIQLSYRNAAGETVRVNPYFDFTVDASGKSVTVTDPSKTRKMVDVSSCNACHEKLALHGGGRVDPQFCVTCHNPGATDANSGNVVIFSTMVHKIHAGRLLLTNYLNGKGGEPYTIRTDDFTEIGFPQDLRNCTVCHSGSNPNTPQGDNWKTQVSKEACLTCHASKAGSDWEAFHKPLAGSLVGPGAKATDIPNAQCKDCHRVGSDISPERVHWNQNEENGARYRFNIAGITVLQAPTDALEGKVEVKYSLTDPTNGNAPYKLEGDSRFNNLRLYVAYQNMVGQPTAVTEFSAYNNGGSGARVNANTGTNDGSNRYTAVITIPKNTATAVAAGTARVITYGAVTEPKLEVKSATDPRPPASPAATVNVVVQNSAKDFALTGTLNPRRTIVSNEKCNVCHGALGSTSGSNTLANAFHDGGRNIVESCVMCHDANRSSSTVMTSGLAYRESYQFKRMVHGIHGNSKRTTPFTHGNPVVGTFDMGGKLVTAGYFLNNQTVTINGASVVVIPAGTPVAAGTTLEQIEKMINDARAAAGYTGEPAEIVDYAAEVAWPGVGINCNACHVNNSYKNDQGPLGAVISARQPDPWANLVISPKAASCTACHDSSYAIGHVTAYGGASFGNLTQGALLGAPRETCNDCHSPGGFKGVDVVHGQK